MCGVALLKLLLVYSVTAKTCKIQGKTKSSQCLMYRRDESLPLHSPPHHQYDLLQLTAVKIASPLPRLHQLTHTHKHITRSACEPHLSSSGSKDATQICTLPGTRPGWKRYRERTSLSDYCTGINSPISSYHSATLARSQPQTSSGSSSWNFHRDSQPLDSQLMLFTTSTVSTATEMHKHGRTETEQRVTLSNRSLSSPPSWIHRLHFVTRFI